jgi:hypothetical protein
LDHSNTIAPGVAITGSGVCSLWFFRLARWCFLSVGGWAPSGAGNPFLLSVGPPISFFIDGGDGRGV